MVFRLAPCLCDASSLRMVLPLAAIVLCFAACRPVDTKFQVVTFRNPNHPETLTERFDGGGSFTRNADGNYQIVFEIPPTLIHSQASDEAEPGEHPRNALPIWASQFIHIEVFWRPLPGTTYAESTQTNANILYCVVTGEDAISYEGAGFAYLDLSRDGKHLRGTLESSTLFPARMAKNPQDLFGPCRVTGTFEAVQDRRKVTRVQRTLRRRLGPPIAPDAHASDS